MLDSIRRFFNPPKYREEDDRQIIQSQRISVRTDILVERVMSRDATGNPLADMVGNRRRVERWTRIS